MTTTNAHSGRITLRAFALGVFVSALFAVLTVYFTNRNDLYLTSTQIPVLPYVLLFATVLFINPACSLLRCVRPFSVAEIMIVLTMGAVSSGISTFGLSSQLIPVIGGLYNGEWNNDQTKWNQYITPFINEDFFVGEAGLQAAARAYTDTVRKASAVKSVYGSALRLAKADGDFRAAQAALASAAAGGGRGGPGLAPDRAGAGLRAAEKALADARADWEQSRPDGRSASWETVLETYPARVQECEAAVKAARAGLAALEREAFAKIEVFRRGLPRELRAFPGFVPTEKDDVASYVARWRRLSQGLRSFACLRELRDGADRTGAAGAAALLAKARERLGTLADDAALQARHADLNGQLDALRREMAAAHASLDQAHAELRAAPAAQKAGIEGRIVRLQAGMAASAKEQRRWLGLVEKVGFEIGVTARVSETVATLRVLESEWPRLTHAQRLDRLARTAAGYRLFDASLGRFVAGDVPWRHWLQALWRWGVLIGLTYLVLMTFNVLIFRQWAVHEKLTYPLAELPETLAGAADAPGFRLPSVFRSGLFWAGAAVSGAFLGFNLLCATEVIPGLRALDPRILWRDYIEKTALQGLLPSARSEIFFTLIGVAFLIPRKISFSLWFFYVLYMLQLLMLVWSGYGVNEISFPAGWWFMMNFRTAEGGGALLVFGAAVLFKCRRYLVCCGAPATLAGLEPDERRELRICSFLFLAGSLGVVVMLWRGMGASLWYTLFYVAVMLLVTVALVRAVAEGGIPGFQAWSNPFHFIGTVFGLNKSWTAPALYVPLMLYHAVLYLDVKAFIAPAMANALKIRSDLRLQRGRFHAAVALCIAAAAGAALVTEVMLGYSQGANGMNNWFYTYFPQLSCFGQIATTSVAPPAASPAETGWILFGGAAMAVLLFLRRFLFWLPHPIGMIMLVNPLMQAYWFSILLGWLAKSLVSRYGGKELYAKARGFFIGLIFGELALVAVTMLISYVFDVDIGKSGFIDLNKEIILG